MMRNKIIPAIDTQDKITLEFLLRELQGEAQILKIGMELYYTFGNDIIKTIKDLGFKVFLDLKLHDIPNTVEKAAKSIAKNGVDILNVHAAGGKEMMQAALNGFKTENSQGILIGVTQLTSTSQEMMNNELLIPGSISKVVHSYGCLVKEAGLAGVVCSAHEVQILKKDFGKEFQCITPGIRPAGSNSHDQKRIMTPLEAVNIGSDYLVIGRAITQAESPKIAFQKILKEIENGQYS